MRGKGGREIEVKLRVKDLKGLRRRLREAGGRVVKQRVFEGNVIYDTATGRLRKKGLLVRVRTEERPGGSRRRVKGGVLTVKSPAGEGAAVEKKYKVREEKEWKVKDVRVADAYLRRTGLFPVFRYEKFRTEWRLRGQKELVVAVDETPIGNFVELEGAPREIDAAAKRLGYGEGKYIRATYGGLFAKVQGAGRDMVFGRGGVRQRKRRGVD